MRRTVRLWSGPVRRALVALLAVAAVIALVASPASPARAAGKTPDASSVQRRLVELRYLPPGAVTGTWNYQTRQALTAFQAWEGLARDGQVGPRTTAALRIAVPPKPMHRVSGREIEVFREVGVTLLVDDGRVVRAVHSSSGKTGFATPTGSYRVFRKELRSWSYPYQVWLPYASYFNGGIAFHASANVPPYPASHGCVRLPSPDASQVYAFARIGALVTVY
jgi:hypothetical protein